MICRNADIEPVTGFWGNKFERAASAHFTPFIWIEVQKLHIKIKRKRLNLLRYASKVKIFDRKTCGDDGAPAKTNEKKI